MTSESNQLRPEADSTRLDFRAVWRAVFPPLILWVAAVLLVTFGGKQPGVVCATPVAWLLGCWAGMSTVALSRSKRRPALLKEAALAGALIGFLQGLLFAVVVQFMENVKPEEQRKSLMLSLAMIAIGTVVAALLSVTVGAAQAKRRVAK